MGQDSHKSKNSKFVAQLSLMLLESEKFYKVEGIKDKNHCRIR